MSWISKGVKKVRKALKLPPITLKNVAKAGAGFLPGGAAISGALNTIGAKGSPGLTAIAKAQVEAFFDKTAGQAEVLSTTVSTAQSVKAAASNPVVWIGAAAAVMLLMGRRR